MSKKSRNRYKQPVRAPAEGDEEVSPVCGICGIASPPGTIICASCGGSLGDESEHASDTKIKGLPEEEELEAEPEIQETDPICEEIEEGDEEVANDDFSPLKIKKSMLLVGIALSLMGVFGVVGLRTGVVQLMLGSSNSSPGIGSAESMGHIVSMIPLVIGFVLIGMWGIRNDPIYEEMEKLKVEDSRTKPNGEKDDEIPEEFIDAVEVEELDIEAEKILPEVGPEITTSTLMHDIAEQLRTDRCEKLLAAAAVLPDDMKKLRALIQSGISINEFTEEVKGAADRWKQNQEKALPENTTMVEKDLIAELADLERCEKMLGAIVVLPDDKQNLRLLISSGISTEEFVKEVKKAVERRKKRELEKDVTADEKASILEDELVAELAELEDELDDDKNDKDLEDRILKEIDELENL